MPTSLAHSDERANQNNLEMKIKLRKNKLLLKIETYCESHFFGLLNFIPLNLFILLLWQISIYCQPYEIITFIYENRNVHFYIDPNMV